MVLDIAQLNGAQ